MNEFKVANAAVAAIARRAQPKLICCRFGISRATAHRRWGCALSLIAWRLKGRRLTMKRLRRFATFVAEGL